MSLFTRSFLASRTAVFIRELTAYTAVLVIAAGGLTFLTDTITQRVAAPVARLLKVGDGFALVDDAPATPVQTASYVLEGDAWLENLKTKWQSDRSSATSSRTESRLGGPAPASDRTWSRPGDGQTHRTMCVRLCDGYYFPISFATTEDKFERDERVCAQSCSSPAKLYVYRNPGQDPEQMVSRDGRPYSKLPTAFQFRSKLDQSCKCTPDPWEQEATDRHRQYAELAAKTKQPRVAEVKPKKVTESGRKKEPNAGRISELPLPPRPEVTSSTGSVRVASATAGLPIVNMQVLTAAPGSVPAGTNGKALLAVSLTAPATDVGASSPPPAKAPSIELPKKSSLARAATAQPKSATAGRPRGGSAVARESVKPASRTRDSADWKVAVFVSR